MTRRFAIALLALSLSANAQAPRRPKLIVAIAVDQFRYDYLTRFRDQYNGGLARLLTQGAVFTNAYYEHFPTVTAIGHSTFLSGATPSVSGIIGNDWWDRATNKSVTSVEDDKVTMLGGEGKAGKAASPRRMLVSTVGDELKISGRGAKVVGVSVKDRSAILPAGHMADGAYWFDSNSGNFVSSTYYFPQLPEWAEAFNKTRMADKFVGAEWKPVGGGEALKTLSSQADKDYYNSLDSTPFSNELVEKFAEAAIAGEQLGKHPNRTDLLAVSFSANDYVGHAVGPDHPQVRDISIRTDRMLGEFFRFLDAQVGMRNVVVVFTADHGVAPVPEVNAARKMPGGRLSKLAETIEAQLAHKYGQGKWILKGGTSTFLNRRLIAERNLNLKEVAETAAAAAREIPHVFRVYTYEQLRTGSVPGDLFDRRIVNGFHHERGADVTIIPDPYYLSEGKAGTTSHGAPFGYDAHVPIVFLGDWIKAGRYHQKVMVNDIAPTLATLMDVETPSGAVGRALHEVLKAPAGAAPAAAPAPTASR
ncbi:MAG: alkaline phosphatase family protein [Bryobacterales bacterium]|nr:alkaline phosphatase family protein [Bryobacterales bacterium]